MKKQMVLLLSGLILISLFAGCSIVEIYDDHIEGCKTEFIIYEELIVNQEFYDECSSELQTMQRQGCEVYCQDYCEDCSGDCGGCEEDCLEACNAFKKSSYSSEDICKEDCTELSPKPITLGQSIPVPRCSSSGVATNLFSGFIGCIDLRNCPAEGDCNPEMALGCTISNNYTCQIVREEYDLKVYYSGSGTIYVNGVPFSTFISSSDNFGHYIRVYFYDQADGSYNSIAGLPSSITITADEGFDPNGFGITLERECCYSCRPKSLPATMLSAKVDIEAFQIVGGDTIIKDGKIISNFNTSPGTQKTTIQVENRGFFTQNEVSVGFEGLPEGITAVIVPTIQKINAHNIGTYEATFTVGPNVPSGKYQVWMIAFSSNGMFDRILVEIVVP